MRQFTPVASPLLPGYEYLTPAQMARALGISALQLKRLRTVGAGPPCVKIGASHRFPVKQGAPAPTLDPPEYRKGMAAYWRRVRYGCRDGEARLQGQGRCCAICGVALSYNGVRPHLDHCHSTGKVRGWLCGPCNMGLGHFGDNPATLAAAIAYLGEGNETGQSRVEGNQTG